MSPIKVIEAYLCGDDGVSEADAHNYWAQGVVQALHSSGYRIVPVEPTKEMIGAGAVCQVEREGLLSFHGTAKFVYRAMIAASEDQPTPSVEKQT